MRCWHAPGVEAHWRTPGTEAQDDGPQPATRERMSAARMAACDEWAVGEGGGRPHTHMVLAACTSLTGGQSFASSHANMWEGYTTAHIAKVRDMRHRLEARRVRTPHGVSPVPPSPTYFGERAARATRQD